jgi:hypothetical protein
MLDLSLLNRPQQACAKANALPEDKLVDSAVADGGHGVPINRLIAIRLCKAGITRGHAFQRRGGGGWHGHGNTARELK